MLLLSTRRPRCCALFLRAQQGLASTRAARAAHAAESRKLEQQLQEVEGATAEEANAAQQRIEHLVQQEQELQQKRNEVAAERAAVEVRAMAWGMFGLKNPRTTGCATDTGWMRHPPSVLLGVCTHSAGQVWSCANCLPQAVILLRSTLCCPDVLGPRL